jgi:hypothetical protein
MRVGGIGGAAVPARRTGRGAGGFALSGTSSGAPVAAPAAAAPVLLAVQQTGPLPDPPEERPRRQAQAALEGLRDLQLALLRGHADPAALARLAALAESASCGGADPGMRALLAEVGLRVKVELARRRAGFAKPG